MVPVPAALGDMRSVESPVVGSVSITASATPLDFVVSGVKEAPSALLNTAMT